jgi:hypothetical protein
VHKETVIRDISVVNIDVFQKESEK